MGTPTPERISRAVLQTALSLKIDSVTAEVTRGLNTESIESILLKGPSVVRLLYRDGEARPYGDSDLLVRFSQLTDAESVLKRLGFKLHLPGRLQGRSERVHHASAWLRSSDGVTVDLHHTLPRAKVAPGLVWEVLRKHRQLSMVGGAEVWELDEDAICLHVAIHVTQHGPEDNAAMKDLMRALELPRHHWEAAASLSRELGLTESFVNGLRSTPEGALLVNELGLDSTPTQSAPVHPRWEAGMPWLLSELRNAKATELPGILARLIFPTPSFMRGAWPIARRGAFGLVAAYAIHPLYLLGQLLRTISGRR